MAILWYLVIRTMVRQWMPFLETMRLIFVTCDNVTLVTLPYFYYCTNLLTCQQQFSMTFFGDGRPFLVHLPGLTGITGDFGLFSVIPALIYRHLLTNVN
jgi:hypothetical protein